MARRDLAESGLLSLSILLLLDLDILKLLVFGSVFSVSCFPDGAMAVDKLQIGYTDANTVLLELLL